MRPFETLESRRLMSVSVGALGGQLRITGTESAENVEVQQDATHILVRERRTFLPDKTFTVHTGGVNSILVNMFGGNDTVRISSSVQFGVTVMTGNGNDRIEGGARNDTLLGGDGHDTIFGGDGNDQIKGFFGNDTLHGGRPTFIAGNGNDFIEGEVGDDVIFGSIGNDTLRGGDGNDRIEGSAGNDLIEGGNHNDTLTGNSGRDTLRGGFGDDRFFARDGIRDIVEGGAGFDAAQSDFPDAGPLDPRADLLISIESNIP